MRPKAPKHGRIKEKYRPNPNAKEKKYHSWLRDRGCLICECEASIHHVTTKGKGRIQRNHLLVTPLCPAHHQGPDGIHMLGHDKFTELYNLDLFEVATKDYKEYELSTC